MCKEKSTTSVDRFKFVSDTQLHKEMWANIASLSEVRHLGKGHDANQLPKRS